MTNTVCQWRDGKLVSVAQWADTREVYRMVASVQRFAKTRTGVVRGLFEIPVTGDRFTWQRGGETDPIPSPEPFVMDFTI